MGTPIGYEDIEIYDEYEQLMKLLKQLDVFEHDDEIDPEYSETSSDEDDDDNEGKIFINEVANYLGFN